jgi:DHA1 family bicyclomycin/chloramphenicol resistance-like MFS transporter
MGPARNTSKDLPMAARGFFRIALVLGLISAIGPFAIDMYLPALPTIGENLRVSPSAVQMTVMAFLVATGACQLFYGPAADIFGRKQPIYFGIGLFVVGSIGCALAPNVETLIAFRVVQGVGACAGAVVPRAIVRDLHTGAEAAKLMSLLMLVFSVSPILAPLTGSFVIGLAGWRGVFWVIAGLGLLGIVLVAVGLKETRPEHARADATWRSSISSFGMLLKDRHYLGLVLTAAFGVSGFFSYLGNSSFIIIEHFHQSNTTYALLFAMNAAAFIGAAQANGWLAKRFGLPRVVRVAVTGFAAIMILNFVLTWLGMDSLPAMIAMLFFGFAFLGLVIPTTSVLALDKHGDIAGAASALMGALHMMVGSTAMAIVGLFADKTPLPMVAGIAACAAVSFTLGQLTLKGKGPGTPAPAAA